MNALQQAAFVTKTQNLSAKRKSLAASAGLFLGTQYHFDLVRPGIAIYVEIRNQATQQDDASY